MAYGSLGISHHATEDMAVMRALPNIAILAPGDPVEAAFATEAAVAHEGPCYLRIGRAGETIVHTNPVQDFQFGKAVTVREGTDITLISAGGGLPDVVNAADFLANDGISARVLSMHTLRPLDEEAILKAAQETSAIFTVEEHSIIGGLGGAVAELLLEAGLYPKKFKRIGLANSFSSIVGDQSYLRAQYGLDTAGIVKTVKQVLNARKTASQGSAV